MDLEPAERLKELEKMQRYLEFSEKYLSQLINSRVAIKDKEGKILKISAYNERLENEIESLRPRMLSEMSTRKGIGRISMHNINASFQESSYSYRQN